MILAAVLVKLRLFALTWYDYCILKTGYCSFSFNNKEYT